MISVKTSVRKNKRKKKKKKETNNILCIRGKPPRQISFFSIYVNEAVLHLYTSVHVTSHFFPCFTPRLPKMWWISHFFKCYVRKNMWYLKLHFFVLKLVLVTCERKVWKYPIISFCGLPACYYLAFLWRPLRDISNYFPKKVHQPIRPNLYS